MKCPFCNGKNAKFKGFDYTSPSFGVTVRARIVSCSDCNQEFLTDKLEKRLDITVLRAALEKIYKDFYDKKEAK